MRIPLWQVDAFTDRVFAGNPAAVCPLEAWLPDATLLAIASENNLAETAFLVREGDGWAIRWFTPALEVDLCGHATLASAHVVFRHLEPGRSTVTFRSQSGPLAVARRDGGLLAMTFPRRPGRSAPVPDAVARAVGRAPEEALLSRDWMAVLRTEDEVRSLRPDLDAVATLPGHGIIVTAPATTPGIDFVSRYFAPQAGIPEDPVTGSAHCTLVPYWAARLGKARLEALQVSRRGGRLSLEDRADAVEIAGRTAEYLSGTIEV
ncbi:PhzF family phenazine biosynthesis protein [Anaeromyxobacter oryzae]|uniref:Isomerase n=1 Tax=Anaeromyxobacter oryzae TaxID=2918170 RepID=A0ABN6MTI9_9BACT|nr:PhzF family phenazine biosynthesis protein [Anaeromyxobacter oryzae]BDG04221.1 putative isomerase [Anaeromyxobacter oryzae]